MSGSEASGTRRFSIKPAIDRLTVGLATGRPGLSGILREALSELPDGKWTFLEGALRADFSEADLIVWDLQPGSPLPD